MLQTRIVMLKTCGFAKVLVSAALAGASACNTGRVFMEKITQIETKLSI